MLEELTALDEVHDEVNSVGFLKNVVKTYDERVVDLTKNQALDFQTFY
jgi:hypothetical protein